MMRLLLLAVAVLTAVTEGISLPSWLFGGKEKGSGVDSFPEEEQPVFEPPVRGCSPATAAAYQTAFETGTFKCLDGSKTLPVGAVNNDYCDCPDGSDEVGTSACAGLTSGLSSTVFTCVNTGHRRKALFLSRVWDGVCDCCDGSDESGNVHADCPNTCGSEYKAWRVANAERLKTLQQVSCVSSHFHAVLKYSYHR